MPHLLPFIDPRPQLEIANLPQPPNPPDLPSLSPTKSINTAAKTALVVENDEFLVKLLEKVL